MAGHGGGAWKVAYADFVTAMMAFFLVMWITAQSKSVKEAIAQYFEHPFEVVKGDGTKPGGQTGAPVPGLIDKGAGPGRGNAKSSTKGKGATKQAKVKIFHDLDRTRNTGTMVLFAEDSADLDEQGEQQLLALVPNIVGKPNKIEIRGHSSRRPLPPGSPYQDSWHLSYARCQNTLKFLSEHGIKPERIRLSQDGEFEPYTNRRDPEWRAQNSRVEVFVISEYAHEFKKNGDERGGFFGDTEEPGEDRDRPAGPEQPEGEAEADEGAAMPEEAEAAGEAEEGQ
jgi:chemotaxis protein MotB